MTDLLASIADAIATFRASHGRDPQVVYLTPDEARAYAEATGAEARAGIHPSWSGQGGRTALAYRNLPILVRDPIPGRVALLKSPAREAM